MMTKAALFVEMESRHTNIEAIEMSSPLSTGFGLTGVFYKLHELLPVIIHADGGELGGFGGELHPFSKERRWTGSDKIIRQ